MPAFGKDGIHNLENVPVKTRWVAKANGNTILTSEVEITEEQRKQLCSTHNCEVTVEKLELRCL